jgi:hypothetical protein
MPNKASQIDHRMYPTTTMSAAGPNPAGSMVPTSTPAADNIPKSPSHLLKGSGDPNMASATSVVQRPVKR